MPTNRPFLANFFAAFRTQPGFTKSPSPSTSPSTASTTTQTASASTSASTTSPFSPTLSSARAIATAKSPQQGVTTSAMQQLSQSRSPPTARTPPNFRSQRRGSDTSSEGGFRDTLGGEKWYIGGKTASGEEKFYKLSMVRKERSGDRLSLDRLSLWEGKGRAWHCRRHWVVKSSEVSDLHHGVPRMLSLISCIETLHQH